MFLTLEPRTLCASRGHGCSRSCSQKQIVVWECENSWRYGWAYPQSDLDKVASLKMCLFCETRKTLCLLTILVFSTMARICPLLRQEKFFERSYAGFSRSTESCSRCKLAVLVSIHFGISRVRSGIFHRSGVDFSRSECACCRSKVGRTRTVRSESFHHNLCQASGPELFPGPSEHRLRRLVPATRWGGCNQLERFAFGLEPPCIPGFPPLWKTCVHNLPPSTGQNLNLFTTMALRFGPISDRPETPLS